MTRKKYGGYIFVTYETDHAPYHVHIYYGGKELGRFDIEGQEAMDKKLIMSKKLRNALKRTGYLR